MQSLKSTLTDAEFDALFAPGLEDFLARDRRNCDCPLTYVHRKYHGALGRGMEIRLCCMAREVERRFGLPEGTFLFAMEFEPQWEWDCEKVMRKERRLSDGTLEVEHVTLGPPPEWLRKRMLEKGIPIRNLPEDRA